MPYYVFAVRPFAQLQRLAEHTSFRDASAQAKALRAQPVAEPGARIQVVFAENSLAAEDLLLQVRDRTPEGEE